MAATTLLASCAKEEGNTVKTGEGETTYAGINITLPASVATRADDPNAGLPGEKALTELGVFIIDNNNGRLDYKFLNVNETNFTETTVDGKKVLTGTTASAIPTVTGTKKVFVVANPTAALKTKLQTSGATAMNAMAFGLTTDKFITGTVTSMVMTGAYTGNSGLLDMTVVKTAAEAQAAPVAITIGRNLSKVVLQEGPEYNVTGGTSNLSWTIVNEAKDAHFIKQAATLYSTVPAEAKTDDTHAYWSNFTSNGDDTYIGVVGAGVDAKAATYAQSKYVFENLPTEFLNGNTTAARIKGVFIPTTTYGGISSGVPTTTTISSGATFLRSKIDGTYWTLAGATAAVAAVYNGHDSVAEDFTTYTNGVGYYTIYVNDGQGNKGVLRNGYYLMQINEVRGPGSPTPNVVPETPVEDDTNIVTKVEVLNWDFMKSISDIQ